MNWLEEQNVSASNIAEIHFDWMVQLLDFKGKSDWYGCRNLIPEMAIPLPAPEVCQGFFLVVLFHVFFQMSIYFNL